MATFPFKQKSKPTQMKKALFATLIIACLAACNSKNESRNILNFTNDWKFALCTDSLAYQTGYDDSNWRTLDLPHDWSIEGSFSPDNPATVGGGALPGGIGWYRKTFKMSAADAGKQVFLKFDGVYMNSRVYVNDSLVGYRPNGYVSFEYDITRFLNFGEKPNTVAVQVDNSQQPNSRWYSGSGIYRNVWLTIANPTHTDAWSLFVTTPEISDTEATVNVSADICSKTSGNATVTTTILNQNGKKICQKRQQIELKADGKTPFNESLTVSKPVLWSTDSPTLYTARVSIVQNGNETDAVSTRFGVRQFEFNREQGFILNGKPLKIRGVCNHHDLGCLGAAVNKRAIERQLEMLKAMGCNGIRTAHNAAAPELLDLCDQMGFIVMADFTDVWRKRKTQFDYATYFDKWHERDLENFIKRDRNHPSIFIWCIGNEVLEQWHDINADTMNIEQANMILNFAAQLAQNETLSKDAHVNTLLASKLAKLTKQLDPTRPVTTGNNEAEPSNLVLKAEEIDLVGFNYHEFNWDSTFFKKFPTRPLIITESTSALMTRGFYMMPSDSMFIWPKRWDIPFDREVHQCSAYDNCHAPWGTTHELTLSIAERYSHVSGIYVWTGFDYLGEPTPFGWPSRSSYFGIIDLAGFPKDVYYLYQSLWTSEPMVYLFPHWNWAENELVDVWVYTNMDEVELELNGVSQGVKSKTNGQLHLTWPVNFAPGELKATGRNADGTTKEMAVRTAGKPERIKLTADRTKITADGKDLAFVTISITDEYGVEVPYADNQLNFEITGNAELAGLDNGDPTNLESFRGKTHKAFNGKCLAVLKSTKKSGKATLTVRGENLKSASIEIAVEKR